MQRNHHIISFYTFFMSFNLFCTSTTINYSMLLCAKCIFNQNYIFYMSSSYNTLYYIVIFPHFPVLASLFDLIKIQDEVASEYLSQDELRSWKLSSTKSFSMRTHDYPQNDSKTVSFRIYIL